MINFFRKIREKKGLSGNLFDGDISGSSNLHLLMDTIGTSEDVLTFLHNTKTEDVAKNIVSEGFSFTSHLEYTTDLVTLKDPLTIEYFNICRRMYGSYTLIIQISRNIVVYYSKKLENRNHHFYEVLTVGEPVKNEDCDNVFILAPCFIKGYVDNTNGAVCLNSKFNSSQSLPEFENNVMRILNADNTNCLSK